MNPPLARHPVVPAGGDPGPADRRLLLPALPPKLVSRPRLLERLDTAIGSAALTLVTAGPGGGKSVMLAEWAHGRPELPAWLAVSRADNDPARFWPLFLRAIRLPGAPALPASWSGPAAPGVVDALFGDERPGTPGDVVVIDDAHLLTDPAVMAGLDRLVQRWGARVRLVMASRSQPLLPLHRYRLSGQLAELRHADLAMTRAEAAALFAAHGAVLDEEEVGRVVARTEGWTGGLRLIALRTEGAPSPARVIDELALDPGSIGEYLVSEVLSVLPEPARRLLLETCFLDEVGGEVAEAITGIEGAADILADLARANSFVVPLDPSLSVFRYHQMFGEILRLLARRRHDQEARDAEARGLDWFREHHDVATAMQWALRRGDRKLARSVLLRGGLADAVVSAERLRALPLDELGPDAGDRLSGDDESAVARAALSALISYRDGGRGGSPPARVHGPEPPPPHGGDPQLRVTVLLTRLISALSEGRHGATSEVLDRLLTDELAEAISSVPGLRGKLLLFRARAGFSAGLLADVEPRLAQALTAAEAEQAVEVELEILGDVALTAAFAARPLHTSEILARAAELLHRHPELRAPPALAVADAGRAYLRADLEASAEALDRAGASSPDRLVEATASYLTALLLSASGRTEEARRWLRAPVLADAEPGLLQALRDAELAHLDVALGRPDPALALLQPYEGGPFAHATAVPAALARLAAGDVAAAERRLTPVFTDPSPQVDRALLVSAFLCEAQLALHRADDVRALDAVSRARELAADDVLVPFVRATRPLAPLLGRHPEAATAWPAPVPAARDLGRPGVPDRLPEPLTERERGVLRLLTTAMSTAEISAELFVSVNTVKTHVAAIYRKLGVTRRRDAVHHARELELL